MKLTAKVTASPAAMRLLAQLPVELRINGLPKALKAGANVVLARMKELTPRGDPADKPDKKPLAETESVVIRKYASVVAAIIGPEYPAGAHGHFVAAGTTPHEITIAKRRALASDTTLFGRRVKHPGAKANPFMQRAIDETAEATDQAIQGSIVAQVEKATRGNQR